MNSILKVSMVGFFCLLSIDCYANSDKKKEKNILVKCHVEFVGGGETIHFRYVKPSKLSRLPNKLINSTIATGSSSGKKRVYQVNECVPEYKDFTQSSAKQLDKIILR